MKSATQGQFLELFAKLLTGVDLKKIDFHQIQKLISRSQDASSLFANFVNMAMKLPLEYLVVGNRYDIKEKVEKTTLQKGDILIFHYQDGTMAAHRESLKEKNVDLHFERVRGLLDDKEITELVQLEDILQACSFYAALMGFRAEWIYPVAMGKGLIYVKFI